MKDFFILHKDIILFITIQFLNVVISTIKSILTINGSKAQASISNAISYTFSAVVTKLLTVQSFEVIVITAMLTNLVGTYVGRLIIEKTKKDKLWTISAIFKNDYANITKELKKRGIDFVLIPAANNRVVINAFCFSKGETSLAKEIFDNNSIIFTITENI